MQERNQQQMRLLQLETLLKKGRWMIFTAFSDEHPDFHLTQGMCDDFGCSDTCRDFKSLEDLLNYLQESNQHENPSLW